MNKGDKVFHKNEIRKELKIVLIEADHVILSDYRGNESEYPRRYFDKHFEKKLKSENMNLLHEFFNRRSDASTPLLAEDQERLEIEFKAFQDNFYKIEKLEDITDPESSYIAIHEYVDVRLGDGLGMELRAGKVIKKHSAIDEYPYAYDLEFTISIDDENKKRHTSRIHNVATGLCVKRTPSYIERQSIEDQKQGKELEDLRRWKKEFSDEYFPIIEFMQENDKDLRIGESIREKVLSILKNHFNSK